MRGWSIRTGFLLTVVMVSAMAASATHGGAHVFQVRYVGNGDTPTFNPNTAGIVVGGITFTNEIPSDATEVAVSVNDDAFGDDTAGRVILTYPSSQVTIRFCGNTTGSILLEPTPGDRATKIHVAVAGPLEQNYADSRQACGSSAPFVNPANPAGGTTGTLTVTFS